MYRSNSPFALALALCALTAATHAQSDNTALEPMVVTATRVPTGVSNVIPPIIVVGRDEIARSGARDLAQILRMHAGLDIGRNGGPGQATSVFIRGGESNHTLVLVDGVRINPGTLGAAAIQNLSPDVIEQIEVLKGPRSSLFGSEAIGGVVNIVTRRARKPLDLGIEIGGGSFGTSSLSANVASAGERGNFSAIVSFSDSDGFPSKQGADADTGHDNLSLNITALRDFGAVSLEGRVWRASGNTQYLDFFGSLVDQDFENRAIGTKLSAPIGDVWTASLDVSQVIDEIEQRQTPDRVKTDRIAYDLQNAFEIDERHTVLAGVYTYREDIDALSFGSVMAEKTDLVAAYAEHIYARDAHKLSYALRYSKADSFDADTTWHIDYGFDMTSNLMLTASAGTGFRAPDATDRFGFGGNNNLQPESTTHYEAGAKYRLSPAQRLEFSAFSTDIDNLITYVVTDFTTFSGQNQNVERASVRGLEARYHLNSGPWGLRVSAIVQRPKDEISGEPLARRARRSLTVSGTRRFDSVDLGLEVLATGARKDSGFSSLYNAGYVLANLNAATRLSDKWQIRGKIENLLDADYQTAAGFNTPGRSMFVNVSYSL